MLPFTRLPGRNQLLWQAYVWQDGAVPFCPQRRRPGDLTLPRQMAGLMSLEEHHVPPPSGTAPAGIRLTSFSEVTFQSSSFFFFFCLLPVARSSHHLTVSCQFSCSAASSLWCTGSNLMFFSRGGWGGVGSLPRYWRSFLCWTYLWPDFYLFSVTFIHISFHLKIFLFFGLFLHLKGLFFGSNMLKVACFGEGDFRPSLLASLVWHTWEIDNTP